MTGTDDLAATLARVAKARGVPPVALLAMVAEFVKQPRDRPAAALERLLARKAEDFLKLRRRLAKPASEAALAHWRDAGASALESGQFVELDKALAQGELQILGGLGDLAAMTPERRLAAGEGRADRAAGSLLELTPDAYREAAKRCGEAAAIIGLADVERSHQLALEQAEALFRLGEDFNDPAGYEAAIAQLRALLSGLDNFDETVRWATAQERLGQAFEGLWSLKRAAKFRHEAASCYRTALEDLRAPQAPALWARLQRRLGSALLELGESEPDIGLLEDAVEAFRAALSTDGRDADAQGRARLRYELGRAHAAIGQKTGGMADLEAAFNELQAALQVWTRETHPTRWSDVQDRMGHVLRAMGERYTEPVVLEEAVACFGRALEERSREAAPLLWATSSANQGLATMQLAQRQKDAGLAQQALAQILTAIEAMRAAGFPDNAAALQKKLAIAGAPAETPRKR